VVHWLVFPLSFCSCDFKVLVNFLNQCNSLFAVLLVKHAVITYTTVQTAFSAVAIKAQFSGAALYRAWYLCWAAQCHLSCNIRSGRNKKKTTQTQL